MIKKLTSVFILCATVIIAQQNSSPYSAFGLGENSSPKTVVHSSMGGIGVENQEYNHLNFVNPAAVAKLRVATYALAGQTTFFESKDDVSSQSGNTTNLRYIALGFSLGRKTGFSAGLQPMSSKKYSFVNKKYQDKKLSELESMKGSGGTNRLYGNFGMEVYKGLAVGIEGAFIFGNIDNSIIQSRDQVTLSSKYNRESSVRGGEIKIGLQYKTDLSKKMQLSTGIATKLGGNLTYKGTEQLFSFVFNSSGVENVHNTLYHRSFKRNIENPLSLVGGIGLGLNNKWYVAINSEYKGTQEKLDIASNLKYGKAIRTSIGGYYIPRINSISSYWDRITYRGGLRYENTGLRIDGKGDGKEFTAINDFGINLGLGLPLPKQRSNLNLGFEYGQRGTNNNNLIKENYYNIKLGLSLNSINWFRKREID